MRAVSPGTPSGAAPVAQAPATPPGASSAATVEPTPPKSETPHSPAHVRQRPAPLRDPRTLADAGDLLRALAAPIRIAIVLQLRAAHRCVHELVDALDVAQPLISQHLRVLKAAGVVAGERHGREVMYRLVDEHLAHIVLDAVTHVEEPPADRPAPIEPPSPAAGRESRRTQEVP